MMRLGLLFWLAGAGIALAQPALERVGLSFACPMVNDPLGRLICGNPDLALLRRLESGQRRETELT